MRARPGSQASWYLLGATRSLECSQYGDEVSMSVHPNALFPRSDRVGEFRQLAWRYVLIGDPTTSGDYAAAGEDGAMDEPVPSFEKRTRLL